MAKKSKKNNNKIIAATAVFKKGDLVFSKIKGFNFWPASIDEVFCGKFRTNFFDYNKTW